MNAKFLLLAITVTATVLIGPFAPVYADEATSSGMNVNLEALEGLNPNRETKSGQKSEAPPPPSTMGTKPETQASPGSESGTVLLLEPQTPVAPRLTIVSTEPAGDRTTEALMHEIIPVLFDANSDILGIRATDTLDDVAALTVNRGVRIQLHAFAGSQSMSLSAAKRLALLRAITIRGYLMDHGIEGSRIDLHPKGAAEHAPRERVDIIFLPQ